MIQINENLSIGQLHEKLKCFHSTSNKSHANLSGNHLIRMCDIFPSWLIYISILNLSNCEIKDIEEKSFVRLLFLKNVNLNNNRLQTLADTLFKFNARLIKLELNNNEIINLTNDFFENTPKLIELYLSDNRILRFSHKKLLLLRILNISYNIIEEFDCNDFPQLLNLSLLQNKLKILNKSMFERLKNLKTLELSNNQIQFIETNSFCNLTDLISLTINNNLLTIIDESDLPKSLNLLYLSIANNKIGQISRNAFWNLRNLISLSLNGNRLKAIDAVLFAMNTQILDMNLSDNEIEDFDQGALTSLTQLNNFYLNNNRSALVIETNLFANNISLEFLSLNNSNIIEILNNAFVNLQALKYLELKSNKIQHLPKSFLPEDVNIVKIDLDYNLLQVFDKNHFQNIKVKFLSLNNNENMQIHNSAFKYLTHLMFLEMSHVSLFCKNLPNLSFLINLRKLALNSNDIVQLPGDYFIGLVNLESLFFDNNNFHPKQKLSLQNNKQLHCFIQENNIDMKHLENKIVERPLFLVNNKLCFLSLSNCDILFINAEAFKYLNSLESLNLSNNKMKVLDEKIFENLFKLETLHLTHNNLTRLPSNLFKNNANLKYLNIERNYILEFNDCHIENCKSLVSISLDQFCKISHRHLTEKGITLIAN